MSDNYLVICCGYEGIEKITGVFDREGAIEQIGKMRANCAVTYHGEPWSEKCDDMVDALEGVDDSDMTLDQRELCRLHDLYWEYCGVHPERICIVEATPEGTKCVCDELGVSMSDTPILY